MMGDSDTAYALWLTTQLADACVPFDARVLVLGGTSAWGHTFFDGHVVSLDKYDPRADVRANFNEPWAHLFWSVDVALMTRASYMIRYTPDFLREVARVLRPDGLFVVDWLTPLPIAHVYDERTVVGATGEPASFDPFTLVHRATASFPNKPYTYALTVLRKP